jgi:D-glycero-D-manno-heptose 1,7-bisphosphate phosphatase
MERILIGIDRDGTLLFDTGKYPGSNMHPLDQFQLMPGVVEGIKHLRGIPDADVKLVMVTNQSGPARCKMDITAVERANARVVELLKEQDVSLDGVYYCAHVPDAYVVKTREKYGIDVPFNEKFFAECRDYKPMTGMIEKAAKDFWHIAPELCRVYVIGDRVEADIELALRAKGTGVFVPSDVKDHSDIKQAHALAKENPDKVYVAKDFADGAKWICADIARRHANNGRA